MSGDEIWVADGTYKPTTSTSRTIAFTMKSGVAVYGGFAGGEKSLAQRDPEANLCTLTGDLLGNDSGTLNLTDNSYHVVVGSGAASTAILDGFTVRGGNANGASASSLDRGGGILIINSGSPTIRNCNFIGNRCTFGGGAGYIFTAGATFVNCRFEQNVGGSYGGAFDMNNVVGTFERCTFLGNSAARAGACESYGGSQTKYTNCIFSGNSATGSNGGGALWIGVSSAVTARNSTFVANSATSLAGCIINTGGSSTVANCILWANTGPGGTTAANQLTNSGGTTSVSYSIVQGGFAGTANLASDPLFVDQAARDFRLQAGSPAIDSGANALVPVGTTVDHAGQPRFVDDPSVADSGAGTAPIGDRGALERQAPPPPACPADLDNSGLVDAADLAVLLAGWGGPGASDLDGSGSTDAADLATLLAAWG
ncbi:MAG: choice-of-anchor Q domain-containing protein, partial [Phycisphaerales bacterium]